MSFFEFPHTRTYDSDLGWLIKHIIEMSEEIKNFINFNTIKYADPILWNITSQYEGNTVVIDPQTGSAYISVQPVPSGVSLYNTDYWTEIFNYHVPIRVYDTVYNIPADGLIDDGDFAVTRGYAAVNDNGAGFYKIRKILPSDIISGSVDYTTSATGLVRVNSTLCAELIIGTVVNVDSLGAGVAGADAGAIINAYAVQHSTAPLLFVFGAKSYVFNSTVTVYPEHSYEGCVKAQINAQSSMVNVFEIDPAATDSAYAFTFKNWFRNFEIFCNANINGIMMSIPSDPALINIHQLLFDNIIIHTSNKAFCVEGYGHVFNRCTVRQANIGFDVTHPEQTTLYDCWTNYAKIGVGGNVSKSGQYGSSLRIVGGSFQRGEIGIQLQRVRNVEIRAYFEKNTKPDIILGNKSSPNYTDACYNVVIKGNTNEIDREAGQYAFECYHSGYVTVDLYEDTPGNVALVNGYSKEVCVYEYGTTPGVITFQGASRNTCYRLAGHIPEYELVAQSLWTADDIQDKLEYINNKWAIVHDVGARSFVIRMDSSGIVKVLDANNAELMTRTPAETKQAGNLTLKHATSTSETASLHLRDANDTGASIRFNITTSRLQAYYGGAWHNISVDS